jgi:hypothetical protein
MNSTDFFDHVLFGNHVRAPRWGGDGPSVNIESEPSEVADGFVIGKIQPQKGSCPIHAQVNGCRLRRAWIDIFDWSRTYASYLLV